MVTIRWNGSSLDIPPEGIRIDSDGVRSAVDMESIRHSSEFMDVLEEPASQFPLKDSEVELEKSNVLIMVRLIHEIW